jgi:hypothetical protein
MKFQNGIAILLLVFSIAACENKSANGQMLAKQQAEIDKLNADAELAKSEITKLQADAELAKAEAAKLKAEAARLDSEAGVRTAGARSASETQARIDARKAEVIEAIGQNEGKSLRY